MRVSKVLYATVESFTRRPGPLFGYAIVHDEHGSLTDRRVRIDFDNMVTPSLESRGLWYSLHDTRRPEDNGRIRLPKAGDTIVFLEAYAGGDRSKARVWTNANLWEEDLAHYASQEFEWRLVVTHWEYYTFREAPGSIVDADTRVVSRSVVRSGVNTLNRIEAQRPTNNYSELTSRELQVLGPDQKWYSY